MSTTERYLELPAYWMYVVVADEHPRQVTAHLFPLAFYTAFCGFNAERSASGFLFSREPAAPEDKRCKTCRRVAAQSKFNVADATP